MTLKAWLASLTQPCRPIRRGREVTVRACRPSLEKLEDRIAPASAIVTVTGGSAGVAQPNAWMGPLPDSIPLTNISLPGTSKSAAGPSLDNAFLGDSASSLVSTPSGVLDTPALVAYLSGLVADAYAAYQDGANQAANATATALLTTALGLQVAGAGMDGANALTIQTLRSEITGVATDSVNFLAAASGIIPNAAKDALAAATCTAQATADTNAALAYTQYANALLNTTGNNPANIAMQTDLRNAAIAAAAADTAGAITAAAGAAAFTAKAVADTAETVAEAAATAAEGVEAIADGVEVAAEAAAGVADGVEAASTVAATIADAAAITADAVAAATIEIPFVDIGTAVAAGIADGVAVGLDAEEAVATAADVAANALAVGDEVVVVADEAVIVGDEATVAADTAADTTAESVATGAEHAVTAGEVAIAAADIAFGRVLANASDSENSVKTQSSSIADQLNSGVRSLDIGGTLVNDTINVNNGQYFTGYTLQGVLNESTAFLQANPSETIVMSLASNENPQGPVNSSNSFNTDLNTLLTATDTAVAGNLTYNDFMYYSSSPGTTPDLGQARGKIVIIPEAAQWQPPANLSGQVLGWQPTEANEANVTVTDAATLWNNAETQGLIPTDLGNPNTLYVNDLTSAGYSTTATLLSGAGNVTPLQVAAGVNPLAAQLFGSFNVTRTTGIVEIDTTGMTGTGNDNDIIGAIINENNLPIVVTSQSDAPGATGTLRDAINQANSQAGVNTIEIASNVQEIVLQADLPVITGDVDIAGSVGIFTNHHQALQNPANENVTEVDLVASDNGQPTTQASTHSVPLFVNTPGVTYIDKLVYDVNVNTDSMGGTGSGASGDLRYCVNQADQAVAAGAPASITFASSLNGQTITLISGAGPLELQAGMGAAAITINSANGVTVSGGGNEQVFDVATGALAALSVLSITNGNTGGITNEGTLTVSNCTVADNSGTDGGGIDNTGMLTVSNCTFSSNTATDGGGSYNAGTLTVTNSTFGAHGSGSPLNNPPVNSAQYGAGIFNIGTALTVSDSTFAWNSASISGGAIFNQNGSPLVVSNCTFSTFVQGNSAGQFGGAIMNHGGTLALLNSTLFGNSVTGAGSQGGGIWNSGTMTLNDTIVAGNSANSGATDPDVAGAVSASVTIGGVTYTEGYNLIGVGAGSSGVTNGANGDQVGTAASPITAELGGLFYNGGSIETMAAHVRQPRHWARRRFQRRRHSPPPTSGEPRTTNGAVDIGAFQTQPPVVLTVTNTGQPGNQFQFPGSLQDCVARANAAMAYAIPATINFASRLHGQPSTMSGLSLSGSDSGVTTLTINGANQITLYGGFTGGEPIFHVFSDAKVVLNGLTILGEAGQPGGGIENEGRLTINSCTVADMSASSFAGIGGGGINNSGELTINDSTISGNSGGGLNNAGYEATLTDCTISGNSGGGIICSFGTVTLIDSTVSGNVGASGGGVGGIYIASNYPDGNIGGTVVLENSIVSGNTTSGGTASDIAEAPQYASLIDDGHNLLGTALEPGVSTDVFSDAPGLAPLANNGGPTQTMALQPGSPALGAGDPSAPNLPATDQRGEPRATDGKLDIGAYEHTDIAYAESLDSNGNLTITQELASANDNLSFALSGGNYTLTDSSNSFDQPTGAGAGFISGAGSNSITIPSADVQSISVVLGTRTNVFTFTGSGGVSVAPINVNAGTTTGDQVIIDGEVLDSGAVTLRAASIIVNANLSAAGDVSLRANPAGTASGNFVGINVNGATVESSGGSVLLRGTGGTGTNGSQFGVEIQAGGIVQTTGSSGSVLVSGSGGESPASGNYGVYITGMNSLVTSGGGSVTVSGTGGDTSTVAAGQELRRGRRCLVTRGHRRRHRATIDGNGGTGGSTIGRNQGVYIGLSGNVSAGGGGTVTIQGTGGSSAGGEGFNEGVLIDGLVTGDYQ